MRPSYRVEIVLESIVLESSRYGYNYLSQYHVHPSKDHPSADISTSTQLYFPHTPILASCPINKSVSQSARAFLTTRLAAACLPPFDRLHIRRLFLFQPLDRLLPIQNPIHRSPPSLPSLLFLHPTCTHNDRWHTRMARARGQSNTHDLLGTVESTSHPSSTSLNPRIDLVLLAVA